MKLRNYLSTGVCVATLLSLSACMDNDYDLGDVDTTARIKVENLTIPLNVDKINLDKILDIEEGSQIKEVKDPVLNKTVYAVLETGSFESDPLDINTFVAKKSNIDDIDDALNLEKIKSELDEQKSTLVSGGMSEAQAEATVWEGVTDDELLAHYPISTKKSSINITSTAVNKGVRTIENVEVTSTKFDVTIHIKDLDKTLDDVNVSGLKIQLPKGLRVDYVNLPDAANNNQLKQYNGADFYNPVDGVLDLSKVKTIIHKNKYSFNFNISNIAVILPNNSDFKNDNITFIPKTTADGKYTEGEFTLDGPIHIIDGCYVEVTKKNFVNGKTFFNLPTSVAYTCHSEMDNDIKVTHFTGLLGYDVEGVEVDPIELGDIPDVLSDDETDVFLKNPQIYLNINNPLANQNIKAKANIKLSSSKNGVQREGYQMEEDLAVGGANNDYCISPTKPEAYYINKPNTQYQKFSGLGNVLSGKGMPTKINVEIVDPQIAEQRVVNFDLGIDFGTVKGEYTFYAPLNLSSIDPEQQTIIMYKDTLDGWNDETLDKLTIETLYLTAFPKSDLPISANLTVKAIDANGNVMNDVEFEAEKIEAYADGTKPLKIYKKTGNIKHLDGIVITATMLTKDETIAPTQSIKLNNLKVRVSGYYDDEL